MQGVAVDAVDAVAPSCCAPRALNAGEPPVALLHTSRHPSSTTTTVVNSTIEVRLLREPPALNASGDFVEGATALFTAHTSDDVAEFRISYRRDPHWHIADVGPATAWARNCDRYREPDAFLGIVVSAAQEPWLLAQNIAGLTLTPPEPPALDWRLTFYGALADAPYVLARCGSQGPEATLLLDNADVVWSDCDTSPTFAFDEAWGLQRKKKLMRTSWPAPAMPL